MNTLRLIGIGFACAFAAMPVHAGGSWFSKVREASVFSAAQTERTGPRLQPLQRAADSTKSVFDIVVSLEGNPAGDNDATQDIGTGDDEQNLFEEAIEEFADGVCQQTNTAHKLGVVRIFRNFDESERADIRWETNCTTNRGPRANPGGFGKDGQRIYMCENWNGEPLIQNAKASGFTLAHEWGMTSRESR